MSKVARFEMPDGRIGRFEVPDSATPEQAQAMIAESLQPKASVEVMSPEGDLLKPTFGETGGGAALGRPINRGQLNVQPTPRPLESALAGATRSAIDPLLAGAQLATGNAPRINELVQRLAQESGQYEEANPKSYIVGRIGGAVLPAVGMAKIGTIPSFANAPTLAQNIGMGAIQGALTPEETGKTGNELLGQEFKQIGGGCDDKQKFDHCIARNRFKRGSRNS